MPSHVFTRVGYWTESIESNAESARVAASDKEGHAVADKEVTVPDFLATVAWSLGLPLEEIVYSPSQRPFTVGNKGKPVVDLFA